MYEPYGKKNILNVRYCEIFQTPGGKACWSVADSVARHNGIRH